MILSIVIPVYNNLFYTQLIIGLIESTTRIDREIIIIDNASTDPRMREYLEYLEFNWSNVKVIFNERNLGVAKAWNQGLENVSDESGFVAFINNDIIIGDRCFERLIEVLEANEDIWCISPNFTNFDLPYNWQELHDERVEKLGLVEKQGRGFFFVVKKDKIKELKKPEQGIFADEQFDMLWYEDKDIFKRFELAGHPAVTVSNILIHHFESKTVNKISGAAKLKAENKDKYNQKYGLK